MAKIVECVPNFSEGRREDVIKAIADAARLTPSIRLLDIEADRDHNRMVLTFIGPPESIKSAVLAACTRATELIDLTAHKGEHPRIGATDVIPIVPISEMTMEECIQLAKEIGKEIAERLDIPVYLYEAAATRPDRINLADVRKGEFEKLRDEIESNPDRKPDFGPSRIHPTAGAVVVGARAPLIAYNVYLGTNNVEVAKKIAKYIRSKDGGLACVKALGFEIKEKGIVQVSMNLVNYNMTPIYRAFELIKVEAKRYGVPVIGSEVVGVVPLDAIVQCTDYYLQMENFKREQILDLRVMEGEGLSDKPLPELLDKVASPTPAPGGGSVSSLAGAAAASLASMVFAMCSKKKEFAGMLKECEEIRKRLTMLVEEDARVFSKVIEAYKLPKGNEEERKRRAEVIEESLKHAAKVPLEVAEQSDRILHLLKTLAEHGKEETISDVGVAALMASAAVRGSLLNVRINMKSIKDMEWNEEVGSMVEDIESVATERLEKIMATVNKLLRSELEDG